MKAVSASNAYMGTYRRGWSRRTYGPQSIPRVSDRGLVAAIVARDGCGIGYAGVSGEQIEHFHRQIAPQVRD